MTPSEILMKHEDVNEHHFYEVDRKWIIEAMEEFAKQAFNASREEVKALSGPAGLKYQTFEDYLNKLCIKQ